MDSLLITPTNSLKSIQNQIGFVNSTMLYKIKCEWFRKKISDEYWPKKLNSPKNIVN